MTGAGSDPGGFAVVGTDTGVGKTVVTAGLVGWLRAEGVDARAVKPCQTGYPPDDDARVVVRACDDGRASVCLRRLEPALAPAVAADRAGKSLSYGRLRQGCRDVLTEAEVGLVEGIGGLRVPLTDDREVIDLVADLGLPALVVARSDLGTLNHTGLTVEALRRRNVPVHGVVCNEFRGAGVAERTNPSVLEAMTDCPVWTLPPVATDPVSVADVREQLPPEVVPPGSRPDGAAADGTDT